MRVVKPYPCTFSGMCIRVLFVEMSLKCAAEKWVKIYETTGLLMSLHLTETFFFNDV